MVEGFSRRCALGLATLLTGCGGSRVGAQSRSSIEPPAPGPRPPTPQGSAGTITTQPGVPDLRVAFGSCNEGPEQPMWRAIAAQHPTAWVWMGDSIYGGMADVKRMRALYDAQNRVPAYAALVERVLLAGTWDDHDYGVNNGGKEFSAREESQQAFLDFLRVPADSPRRTQRGVYTSHTLGDGARSLKLILLDCRYHREAPGIDADVLGEEQWAWLETELTKSQAAVHLIGSSIQVIASEHPYEKWANFPNARERLFELVRSSGAPGVVFLSGDRHIAELSMLEGEPYPLHDLTSSGLTHSWTAHPGEPNRYRVGQVFTGRHFGVVDVEWDAGDDARGQLRLAVLDEAGVPRIEQRLRLETLRA